MNDSLFIWIPKNAGTSIYHTLRTKNQTEDVALTTLEKFKKFNKLPRGFSSIGHLSFKEIKEQRILDQEYLSNCWKFAFVRNPYSRIVSLHRHIGGNTTLEEYLQNIQLYTDLIGLYNIKGNSQSNPQYKWIYDKDMNLVVDFIGRFENLQEDFDYICKQLDIEPMKIDCKNKRCSSTCYLRSHTPETIELTKKIYKKDFELLGYSYDINQRGVTL